MSKFLAFLFVSSFFISCIPVRADNVTILPPPGNVTGVYVQGDSNTYFYGSSLAGTPLVGQAVSWDVTFGGKDLELFFDNSDESLYITLELVTNEIGFYPGDAGITTATLIGPNGQPVGVTQNLSAFDEDNFGTIYLPMRNLGYLGGGAPIVISGIHFDTTLPVSPYVIQSANLDLEFHAEDEGYVFLEPVTEPSSLLLVFVGLTGVALFLKRR